MFFGAPNFWVPTRIADVCSLHVQSNIRYRYAHTTVHSEVCNTADVAQEVMFSITLPETSFISSFSIEINGKVYNAYVKGKEEAQRIYTEAVQHGRTAGHVAVSARDSNRFNVTVNMEQRKKVIFRLTYEELLSRKLGLYKHIINLDPGQIVQDFTVTVNIEESSDITELKVATLKQNNEAQPSSIEMGNSLANIERPNPHTAVVRFAPTPEQQQSLSKDGIRGQFIVQYDVDRSALHSQILVNDGYFTHYFAPEQLKPLPKHVTFVLDVSSSMHGRKIDQLKEAMEKILSDLHPQDYFSLLIFSSGVQVWRLVDDGKWDIATLQESDCNSLVVPATKENILRGKLAIYKLKSKGNTNIHQAMMVATHITQLRKKLDTLQPPEPIIIFLTDGQPTTGICHREEIINETTRLNQIGKAIIFTLGLGNDVDFEFLKKLALRNSGFSRKIYEASDATLQLTDFYKEVSSPLLSNITFIYQPEQVESISVTRHNFVTFFRGSELIVSGRIDPSVSEMEFRFGVTGNCSEGMRNFLPEETRVVFLKKAGFMERLWAYLTIQQLLDEEKKFEGQMSSDKKCQAMQLALKYSFVTPVTSLVVVRPDDQHCRATVDSDMERLLANKMVPQSGRLFGSSAGYSASFGSGQSMGSQSSHGFTFGSGQASANQGLFGSGQSMRSQSSHGLTFGSGQAPANQGLFGSGQSMGNPSSHGFTFGSGQAPANQGLFGSAQSMASQSSHGFTFGSGQVPVNQELFGSAQSVPSPGNHGLTFGSGQVPANQGLFGSAQSVARQGNHGLTFSSGETTTNPESERFTFGQNVPGEHQYTDVIKPFFKHNSGYPSCKICKAVFLGNNLEDMEKHHMKVDHPSELAASSRKVNSVLNEKHLIDALMAMVLVDGRPLSMLNESWLKKILDPIVAALKLSITPNLIHQKIADQCYQVEQIIAKELTDALVCLKLEIATKNSQTFLAIHAQYISEGNKIIRTLTVRNLNRDLNKNHMIDFVITTLERFGIKNVFFITINIIENIPEFLDVSSSSGTSKNDKIFKTLFDACSILGMSVFWNPTYTMQLAVHQSMETHQGITDEVKNLKLTSQEIDQHSGMFDPEHSLNTTDQKQIASFQYISQTFKSMLTSFQENKWQFGDVYNRWINCQETISKLGTSFAETLSTNMKKTADEILRNPVFLSVLFLDPRYKFFLNDEQKSLAIEELKILWKSLSNLKDVEVFSNEDEIVEKLKCFATIPQMSEDIDILQFWESQIKQHPDLNKLARVLLSVPVLQDTIERLSLNYDIMFSTEPINIKQDIVKIRCFNEFYKSKS